MDDSLAELGDVEFASSLAHAAGQMLLSFQGHAIDEGMDPSELKDAGDARSQSLLAEALTRFRAADAVLSEEAEDGKARLDADRVWIIDPLDGTREYSEGRHDWAVHVALFAGGELVAGAVALPGIDQVLDSRGASDAPGASPESNTTGDNTTGDDVGNRPLRIAASRSRAPKLVTDVAEALGAELVPMGSAGFKASAVVRGEVDAYLHAGGQYEWDSAAPVAVARGGGFHTSRVDGAALAYNQPNPYLPDLLVCRAEVAELFLRTIGRVQ